MITNSRQAQVSAEKLRLLQQRYTDIQETPTENEHHRDLTLRSLKRLINQITEEIARFEAKTPA